MQSLLRLQPFVRRFVLPYCARNRSHTNRNIPRTVAALKRQQEAAKSMFAPQKFANFLVVDFEATCRRDGPPPYPQEIIEFPVIQLSGSNFEELSRFHSYVEPDVHKQLSDFCVELTGIVQAMVDGQPNLEDVLDKLELWMQDNSITEKNSAVVTFGDWDLASALTNQCHYLQLDVPPIFRYWINVKKSLLEFTGVWPTSLTAALQEAELEQTGRLHSGIDDCVNIAKLVRYLGQNGYVFNFTASNKHYNPPIES